MKWLLVRGVVRGVEAIANAFVAASLLLGVLILPVVAYYALWDVRQSVTAPIFASVVVVLLLAIVIGKMAR